MVPGEVNLIVLQFYLFFTCREIRTRPGRDGRAGGDIDHSIVGRGGGGGSGFYIQACLSGKEGEHVLEMFH